MDRKKLDDLQIKEPEGFGDKKKGKSKGGATAERPNKRQRSTKTLIDFLKKAEDLPVPGDWPAQSSWQIRRINL